MDNTWINSKKKMMKNNSFLRNVALLSGGTAVSQIISVITIPLVTRFYTPQDFGILSIYISLMSMLAVVVSLRYEMAIPLAHNSIVAKNVRLLALIIVLVVSVISGLFILMFGSEISSLLRSEDLKHYLYLLPFSLFGIGLYQILCNWAIREKNFRIISRTKITQSLFQVAVQLVLGLIQSGPLGLILGDVVGRIGGSSALAKKSLVNINSLSKNVSLKKLIWAAIRYKNFPKYLSWSSLLNSAGLQLPPILLAVLYGPQIAGYFMLSQKVIGIPMSMVGMAVSQVYYSECSRLIIEKPSELIRLYLRSAKYLTLIGFIMILPAVFAPSLFSVIFGPSWNVSGQYLQVMTFMILAQFVVSPLSQSLIVIERQDLQLIGDAFRLLVILLVFYTGYKLLIGPTLLLLLYSISMFIMYVIYFLIYRNSLQHVQTNIRDLRLMEG